MSDNLTTLLAYIAIYSLTFGCGVLLVLSDHPWFGLLMIWIGCNAKVSWRKKPAAIVAATQEANHHAT